MMAGKTKLQAVRLALGYKQEQVIRLLIKRAAARNASIASESALRTMLSRWENGHDQVTDPTYQALFRDVYARTNEELGFPAEPSDDSLEDLRNRLIVARSVDAGTVELFARQVDNARHVDRRFGATALLDQLNSQVKQITELLSFGTLGTHRTELAAVLADAATLAGWEALDRGSLLLAWNHHETAKAAAREAGSASLLAYATAQQAFILIDLERPDEAAELLGYAKSEATGKTAKLLESWLSAAHGEGLAAANQADAALHAFDVAGGSLPEDPNEPDLPFLMLNSVHLTRWRGHALARLGSDEAIAEVEAVLESVRTASARATAGALVDLAYAYAAKGDRDAAVNYVRMARQLAGQIGSERQKRRLSGLVLPGGAGSEVQQGGNYGSGSDEFAASG